MQLIFLKNYMLFVKIKNMAVFKIINTILLIICKSLLLRERERERDGQV